MSRATESVLAEREALIKRVKELEDEVACLKLRNENLLDVTEGMKAAADRLLDDIYGLLP